MAPPGDSTRCSDADTAASQNSTGLTSIRDDGPTSGVRVNLQLCNRLAAAIITVAGLIHGRPAAAIEIEPLHVELRVSGKPFLGEGCEGGEWSVSWSGDVPGETNNISDLLISYSSFDTTHESAPSGPPATVRVNNITCRDHKGAIVLQTSMGGGKREVRTVGPTFLPTR